MNLQFYGTHNIKENRRLPVLTCSNLLRKVKPWKLFGMVGPGGLEPPTNGL